MATSYRLSDNAAHYLHERVQEAATDMAKPVAGTEQLIADLYTGRNASTNNAVLGALNSLSQAIGAFPSRILDGSWAPPETALNLVLSRLQQIISGLIPAKPTFHTKPRLPGAARLSEDQNQISQFVTDHGGLLNAMKRSAFSGMMSPYFAVKFVPNYDGEVYEKVSYEPIESKLCGYEPFQRRFMWHTYGKQWGQVPAAWRKEYEAQSTTQVEINPWDMVRVTEVYHKDFDSGHPSAKMAGCPMSVFVRIDAGDQDPRDRLIEERYDEFDPGVYLHTEHIRACPLVIRSYNQAAPNEDVAPAEIVSWLPQVRKITMDLIQINREVRNLNTIVLYRKGAVSQDHIDSLAEEGVPSETVYVPVDTDDSENGVNATMRPVEQSDNLMSLLQVLQTDLALFDDMIGLGPAERGIAQNPRKSATEASSITAASNRRNRARLEVIADAMAELFQIQFEYQRDLFGEAITIPNDKGLEVRLDVPDPATAKFAFEVDPVELGHLTKQGDAESLFNGLTVVSNTLATFQGAIPKAVREMLRRVLHAQGIPDADALIDLPTLEAGPEDRFMEHLLSGAPIDVHQDDQHQAYVGYYEKQMQALLPQQHPAIMELEQAIGQHNVFIRQAAAANINPAAQANVVPGVTESGMDNQMAAQVAAGQAPNFAQAPGAIPQI